MTAALVAANRRNAQKSTGPRTARGKAQARMNALRTGDRSRLRWDLLVSLLDAPPCGVTLYARALLTPEMALCPLLRETAEIAIQAEREVAAGIRESSPRHKSIKGDPFFDQRSGNVNENKGAPFGDSHDVTENKQVNDNSHDVFDKKWVSQEFGVKNRLSHDVDENSQDITHEPRCL